MIGAGRSRVRLGPRVVLGVGVLGAVLAFAAGVGVAKITIASGAESASGQIELGGALTWWSPVTIAADLIPAPVPTALSTSAASPTPLPGTNGSFVVGTAIAGHAALRWDFSEKSAPASTEFTLTITYVNATTGAMTTLEAFAKTQTSPPTGTMTWSVYLDVGTNVASVSASSELAQQCPSSTTCP